MSQRTCCNPAHPKEQPIPALYVLVDRQDRPHFLCDPCSRILDDLGNLDTFIQEIDDYDREQMTPEERRREDWLEYGDRLYDLSVEEGLL